MRQVGFETIAGPHYGLKRMLRDLVRPGRSPLGRGYWCAKTFPSEKVTQGLLTLYPGIRFIYIARNGCDIVHSRTKFKGFTHQDFRVHCENWAEGVEKYRHLTSLPAAVFVKQEELLAAPGPFFARLFQFLAIPEHPGPERFASTHLIHPLDKATRTDADPRAELAHREPSHAGWNDEQKRLFAEVCGPGMRELGYDFPF